jgi:hypothetical protein
MRNSTWLREKPFCWSFGRKINANRMPPAHERFAKAASAILLLRADERF